MAVEVDYDIFLAHAGADAPVAAELHRLLAARAQVFLDKVSVIGGDAWDVVIPTALRRAPVVVVLVGRAPEVAYYLRDEIRVAVARSREGKCRVVPVLVDGATQADADRLYGLGLLQCLDAAVLGLDGVAERVLASPELAQRVAAAVAAATTPASSPPVAAAPIMSPPATADRELTWVHVSDLHIGHGDAAHAANQTTMLARLLDDARQMYARLVAPDLVLVTGDVAQSGRAEQYATAATWLGELCATVNAPRTALAVVPGNHDVDRSAVSIGARTWHSAMALQTGGDIVDDLVASKDDAPVLYRKLGAYAAFATTIGSPLGGASTPWWTRTVRTRIGEVLLVGLNSALACLDDGDRDRVTLGEIQRGATLRSAREDGLTIVLMHHPPTWLRDGRKLTARLQNLPHVLLTGHVHESGAAVDASLGAGGVLRFSAGAVHGGKSEGDRHGYAWGRLTSDGLSYYPRVWSAARGKFVADRDHALGDGEAVTEERARLPRPMDGWLPRRAAVPSPPPPPEPPRDPVRAENPHRAGSAPAALFEAFQLDRTDQWHFLRESYHHTYAVLFLSGHPIQSLPLFVDRARHDLERHGARTTKVLHTRFSQHARDAGLRTAETWLAAAARKLDAQHADVESALLAAARAQDVLWVLGPIPHSELVAPDYAGLRDLIGTRLRAFLRDRHRGATTNGFRVLVLVSDGLPADASDNPTVLAELEALARPVMRDLGGTVVELPRAHLPVWATHIEPVLRKHQVADDTRAAIKAQYDQLLKQGLITFQMFAVFLESVLRDLGD